MQKVWEAGWLWRQKKKCWKWQMGDLHRNVLIQVASVGHAGRWQTKFCGRGDDANVERYEINAKVAFGALWRTRETLECTKWCATAVTRDGCHSFTLAMQSEPLEQFKVGGGRLCWQRATRQLGGTRHKCALVGGEQIAQWHTSGRRLVLLWHLDVEQAHNRPHYD